MCVNPVSNSGGDNAAALEEKKAIEEAWSAFHSAKPSSEAIRTRIANLKEEDLKRAQAFAQRKPQQVPLPLFYTTSIGSLPQTTTVRGLRVKLQRGRISADEYRSQIDQHIAHSIGLQEGLGIDVPVHGEFERTDMVEYFGQKIDGFAFTNNGYCNRGSCVVFVVCRVCRVCIVWSVRYA